MIKNISLLLSLVICSMFVPSVQAQSFKIKLDSPILASNSDSLIGNSNHTSNGIKREISLNLHNLKGAGSSSSFCSNSDNSSIFASKNVICSAGSSSDRIKVTIPLSLSYDVDQGLQIDIVGYQQNNGMYSDPLLNIVIGNTILTNSGSLITELSNISSSSGNLKSEGYGGVNNNRNANISFEVPYKGNTFKSERSSIIKIFTVVQSI